MSVIASQIVKPHCDLSQHFCNELRYLSHFRFLTVIQQLLRRHRDSWATSEVMWQSCDPGKSSEGTRNEKRGRGQHFSSHWEF